MSASLFDSLAGGLSGLLGPVVLVVEEPALLPRLLGELGVPPDTTNNSLVQALSAVAQLKDRIEALGTQEVPSFENIAAVLDAAADAFEALRRLEQQGPLAALEGLGRELVDLLLMAFLESRTPAVRPAAALLTLLEPAEERQGNEPIVQGGRLVRDTYRLDRWHADRLPALLKDPLAVLRAEYGNAMQTAADAHAMAEKLFPRLVRLLRALGVTCRYGFDPDDAVVLGDAAPLVAHALIVYVDDPLYGAAAESGIVLSLSAADQGDLGLVISPFGTIAVQGSAGPWKIAAALTAGIDVVAWGRHGVTLLASPGTIEAKGSASATLATSDALPAYVIGQPDGARIEVDGARLGFDVTLSDAHASLAVSADVLAAALVIAPGNGDEFLASLLPSEGLRTEFDLGLAWSSDKGLTLRGSAGLEATVPVGLSVAGVSLLSLHVALQARDGDVRAEVSASLSASIGPVRALLDRVGIEGALSFPQGGGNLGVVDLDFGFKAPSGVGLSIDAGPVVGSGFLAFDPERGEYAGQVQLRFEGIAVRATGLLTTRLPGGKPGFSLLVIVSAEFPPVQLGYGFMLVGVGGLLGINRTVAVEALRAGLKTGALGAVLSPPDPKGNVGQLVATLAGLFPPAAGRHVFAPTARIVWGSPTLITIELCLVLELPAPVRLVVLGRLRALLPDEHEAIVRIQVDVLGVIDFDRAEAAVDATLVDSRLAQFALTGDMALRMSWGAQPSFLLAVGGFHPRFAAPPGFPALERVAVALAADDNPKLRLEAYLALTSNTVQFGARVDLAARAGSFSIAGFLSFDALVTLAPLAFVVDIAAKLAVKAGGRTILSVSLALTLSGPRPWHARGRASFSILFFDVSFGFDVTIGDDAAPVLPAPVDVAPLLLAALADARSWSAQPPAGASALVTLRALDPGTAVLAHPLATLEVRQRVAPLERTLERFGTSVPSGARRFRITLATIGGVRTTLTPLQDRFAPAQFAALSDDEKLSAPSFEDMPSGAALGADDYATGTPVSLAVVYEQLLVTAPGVPEPKSQRVAIPGDVFVMLTATPPKRAPAFALRAAA
jgi:hypothetical protein